MYTYTLSPYHKIEVTFQSFFFEAGVIVNIAKLCVFQLLSMGIYGFFLKIFEKIFYLQILELL